jgi:hypothetical protein
MDKLLADLPGAGQRRQCARRAGAADRFRLRDNLMRLGESACPPWSKRADVDGIIDHGTDTLEETAFS